MKILYRIIIMFGFGVPGLFLGALWASKSGATQGAGLAGGAIAAGYALMGAVIAMAVGLVVAIRLSEAALPRTAAVMGALILLFVGYASIRVQNQRQFGIDPPEAYAGIPMFTLELERTDRADPVLARRLTVNSEDREWTSLLPDGRTCSAQASAEPLQEAADALTAFLATTDGAVSCDGAAEVVVRWSLDADGAPSEGQIELNDICLRTESEAQYLVFALQQVSLRSDARVDCR